MNDRYRTTPIALPRYAPVTKPESGFGLTGASGGECFKGCLFARFDIKPVPRPRIDQFARASIGGVGDCKIIGIIGQHNRQNRQIISIGKIKIALVMCRTAENGACAIIHQHKIGDMDWQSSAINDRMRHAKACIIAFFVGRFDRRFGSAELGTFGGKISRGLIIGGNIARQRMIRRNGNEGGTI